MKKLIFTALVAIVAVGGAYAQEYASFTNSPADKTCSGAADPLCGAETYIPFSTTRASLTVQNSTIHPL